MLILTEYNKNYIIESLTGPVVPKFCWTFSGPMLDFMLSPITYLEETTGPTKTIEINGFRFEMPAGWNILITERETFQLDTVPIASCSSQHTLAFVMSPTNYMLRMAEVKVVDYCEEKSLVHPLIAKGTGLCHPAGCIKNGDTEIDLAVVITPHDLYKHIAGKAVGDIMP